MALSPFSGIEPWQLLPSVVTPISIRPRWPRSTLQLVESVTIDLDTTDVEVYGRKKRGVEYNHQGQRVGRPHVATWAEMETCLAAELFSGNDDARASAPDMVLRALSALPRVSGGVGYGCGLTPGISTGNSLVWRSCEGVEFAIGAKRIAPLWRLLAGLSDKDWTDAVGMDGAQVAVSSYRPAWWPSKTEVLIRRVTLGHLAGVRGFPVETAPHAASRSAGPAAR